MFSERLIAQLQSFSQIIPFQTEESVSAHESYKNNFKRFELFYEIITEEFNVNFTTLFTRISFTGSLRIWPKGLIRLAHIIRKAEEEETLDTAVLNVLNEVIPYYIHSHIKSLVNSEQITIEIPELLLKKFSKENQQKIGYLPVIEGLITDVNTKSKEITFLPENETEKTYTVLYNVADTNELFTKAIESVVSFMSYPLPVNLIDIDILAEDRWVPKAFIIFPDYLIDVTTISSVHNNSFTSPWLYMLNRFQSKEPSLPVLTGNVANHFLDLLVKDNEADFNDQLKSIFNTDPLLWAIFDDDSVKKALADLKIHFSNLKRVINSDFKTFNISTGKIYLEPSFYCKEYGIQGRLDLFHINDERTKAEIIELKSGKIYKPNAYGINQSHYSQTLLYDIIIKSVYKNKVKSSNFILYSLPEKDNLKLAPGGSRTIYELLKIRNEIVLIEHAIVFDQEILPKVYKYLATDNFPNLKGFSLTDLSEFQNIYSSLRPFEKEYFVKFSRFIAHEHLLAKTGEHGLAKSNGLSGLWLESLEEKMDRFAVLNHLVIIKNASDELFPTMTLRKTDLTAVLSNFRVGDIAVLYPYSQKRKDLLHHEIFKCTILEISENEVSVRMRHPQINHHIFKTKHYWHLEEDVLDSSFRHMYRGLFELSKSTTEKRDLILGRSRPEFNDQEVNIDLDEKLTAEQKSIIRKILKTRDYLLLWGPPGTGKTSQIIKNVASSLYLYANNVVIYLAYTNRAVDEICDALAEAGLKESFVRIGSRFAIDRKYEGNLLDVIISQCKTRSEIIKKLKNCKIFVSTISSLSGKTEIFDLVDIHTAIIDEASQILEPSLVGLLTRFERFILIGDHKQLPAVVTQRKSNLIIENGELSEAGFKDLSMSYFERLLAQCHENNWMHAVEILSHQGRMHVDIMNFVSKSFYHNKLKPIHGMSRLMAPVNKKLYPENIFSKRLIFIKSKTEFRINYKTNRDEAEKVVAIVNIIEKHLSVNKVTESERPSIGIITPYRAQIALIKSLLPSNSSITVDTVERYQGSARDVIIFSTCTSTQTQLERLVSRSLDGIDRKLNVAITRAREFFILIGNDELLSKEGTYEQLILASEKVNLDIL